MDNKPSPTTCVLSWLLMPWLGCFLCFVVLFCCIVCDMPSLADNQFLFWLTGSDPLCSFSSARSRLACKPYLVFVPKKTAGK